MSIPTNMDLLRQTGNGRQTIRGVVHDTTKKNGDLLELNELSKESNGGTELTHRGLYHNVDRSLLEQVQIISSRVREIDENRPSVLWLHDLALDGESDHLKMKENRDRFSKLVFSSHWQYQQFRDYLAVPYDMNYHVIETGIDPIELVEKPKDKIRLIYTSTPHRGLEILVPVFIHLAQNNPDIELDVFSSFGIYGSGWTERDQQYEQLFEMCRQHPQINYHGWSDNETVRKAYQAAHIFAYPNIWQETSCRSLIEAMSAGCVCVHPNYAALSETSGGLTNIYAGDYDKNIHANVFAAHLQNTINNVRSIDYSGYTRFVKMFADKKHGWSEVGGRWTSLIEAVIREHENG